MKLEKRLKYPVVIDGAVNGGYLVRIGCTVLPYTDYEVLCRDLRWYFENPERAEKEYLAATSEYIATAGHSHPGRAERDPLVEQQRAMAQMAGPVGQTVGRQL